MKEVFSHCGSQVKLEVFTVSLCQLSHEVDSLEESVNLHAHFPVRSAHLSAAHVTNALTHPRWPKVATK